MRKLISLAAAAAIAAAALAACSPPGEVPTDKKVKTATEIAAPTAKAGSKAEEKQGAAEVGVPKFIGCDGKPGELPSSFPLDCADGKDKLTSITWSKVTRTSATGTGTRVTTGDDGKETRTTDVPVVLSGPVEQSDGLVFTKVTVDGTAIALG